MWSSMLLRFVVGRRSAFPVVKAAWGSLATTKEASSLLVRQWNLARVNTPTPQSRSYSALTHLCRGYVARSSISLGSHTESVASLGLSRLPDSVPLLAPHTPALAIVAGYKVKMSLRKRCPKCFFVRRQGRLFVECKSKPRHKQMQKMSKQKLFKED